MASECYRNNKLVREGQKTEKITITVMCNIKGKHDNDVTFISLSLSFHFFLPHHQFLVEFNSCNVCCIGVITLSFNNIEGGSGSHSPGDSDIDIVPAGGFYNSYKQCF